jgi:hypothetical protein
MWLYIYIYFNVYSYIYVHISTSQWDSPLEDPHRPLLTLRRILRLNLACLLRWNMQTDPGEPLDIYIYIFVCLSASVYVFVLSLSLPRSLSFYITHTHTLSLFLSLYLSLSLHITHTRTHAFQIQISECESLEPLMDVLVSLVESSPHDDVQVRHQLSSLLSIHRFIFHVLAYRVLLVTRFEQGSGSFLRNQIGSPPPYPVSSTGSLQIRFENMIEFANRYFIEWIFLNNNVLM